MHCQEAAIGNVAGTQTQALVYALWDMEVLSKVLAAVPNTPGYFELDYS